MFVLHVRPASGEPFEFPLEATAVVIGRSGQCDLRIADRFLSRQHARITRHGEIWQIEDLGSRNGTFVNQSQVQRPTEIRPGDSIRISSSTITVALAGREQPAVGRRREADAAAPRAREQPTATLLSDQTIFRPAATILTTARQSPGPAQTGDIETYAQRLRIVNEVHEALSGSVTVDELLELILDRVFEHLKPQNGAVFLKDGDTVYRALSRTQPGVVEEFPESTSLVGEVVDKGLAAFVPDTGADARFSEAESILAASVRSLVAAPLLTPEGASGMIVLSANPLQRPFSEEDLELLVPLASAAAMHIRSVALAEEAAERRRLEKEVALARRIQSALLPAAMPTISGLELHGSNQPSQGVSGDYYQVLKHDDGRLALLIADVSGKGIGASLLTSYVDALCLAYLGEGNPPHRVFSRVSPRLNAKTPTDKFATALLAYVDPETGSIEYASAGHDPGLVIRADGTIDWLEPTGIPLGLLPEADYTLGTAVLAAGDTLVLYTDGIVEAFNRAEEEFGRERLAELCARHRAAPVAEIAGALETELEHFVEGLAFHDDRTLVLVKRV